MKLTNLHEMDDQLRQRERREKMDDSSPGKLLLQRVRAGQIPAENVKVAAALRHPVAMEVFPDTPAAEYVKKNWVSLLTSYEALLGFVMDCVSRLIDQASEQMKNQSEFGYLTRAVDIIKNGGSGREELAARLRPLLNGKTMRPGYPISFLFLAADVLHLLDAEERENPIGVKSVVQMVRSIDPGITDWQAKRFCQYLLGEV